jgi:DNA-binding MarR family transcriptional regulator
VSADLTTTQAQPTPVPEANLGYLFRLAHQRFRARLEEELQDLGLSAQEYAILSVFDTRAELSTSELARVAQVTRQTMHAAILKLEAAGVLERRAKNKRVVLVAPTEHGRRTLEAATGRVRAIERAVLAGLTDEDERAVRRWLADMAATPPSPRADESRERTSDG